MDPDTFAVFHWVGFSGAYLSKDLWESSNGETRDDLILTSLAQGLHDFVHTVKDLPVDELRRRLKEEVGQLRFSTVHATEPTEGELCQELSHLLVDFLASSWKEETR